MNGHDLNGAATYAPSVAKTAATPARIPKGSAPKPSAGEAARVEICALEKKRQEHRAAAAALKVELGQRGLAVVAAEGKCEFCYICGLRAIHEAEHDGAPGELPMLLRRCPAEHAWKTPVTGARS